MKLALLMAFVLSATGAGVAQTARLECGHVELQIGEPEKEAIKSLTDAGYSLAHIGLQEKSQIQILYNKNTKESCDVAFSKGRLAYTARRWENNISSEIDAMRNVVGALQSISKLHQHDACDVYSYQNSSPTSEIKSVSIACGGHTVSFESGTINGNPMYDIEESVGVLPR